MKKFATVLLTIVISTCVAVSIGDKLRVDPENDYAPVVIDFGPTRHWVKVSPNATVWYRWGNDLPDGYEPGTTWFYVDNDGTIVSEYNSLDSLGHDLYLVKLDNWVQIVNSRNLARTIALRRVFTRITFPKNEAGQTVPFVNGKLTCICEAEPCENGLGNLEIYFIYAQTMTRIGGLDNIYWAANNDGYSLSSESRLVGRFAFISELRINVETGQLTAWVRRSLDQKEQWRWVPIPLPTDG